MVKLSSNKHKLCPCSYHVDGFKNYLVLKICELLWIHHTLKNKDNDCVWARICVCACVYMYVCDVYVYICMCIYVCMCIYLYICACMCVCLWCVYVHVYVCVHACVCSCVYVCVCGERERERERETTSDSVLAWAVGAWASSHVWVTYNAQHTWHTENMHALLHRSGHTVCSCQGWALPGSFSSPHAAFYPGSTMELLSCLWPSIFPVVWHLPPYKWGTF